MSEATLIAQCGTTKVSREELKVIPVPESTRTFKPIPHHEIVDSLVEALGFRYIGVVRDEYAVSSDGMKMFGVLDLEQPSMAVDSPSVSGMPMTVACVLD